MQERTTKGVLIKYIITAAAGLAVAVVYSLIKGLFSAEDIVSAFRILSDAFTLPGILLLCFGLLTFINKEGMFDGLAYSFKSMRRVRRNFRADDKTPKTYYDYKQSVKSKRHVAWHLLFVGAGYLLLAIVFIVLHSIYYVEPIIE